MGEIRSRTIGEFLEELSSANPTPGGGSVAALSAAIAAGLGLMVGAIGLKKREDKPIAQLVTRLNPLREDFLDFVGRDEEAFSAVMDAYHLPKEDKTRPEAIQGALRGAAEVPLQVAEGCVQLLELLVELAPLGTRQSVSDVGVAALLGKGALEAALLNVEINLAYIKNEQAIARIASRKDELSVKGAKLAKRALARVQACL